MKTLAVPDHRSRAWQLWKHTLHAGRGRLTTWRRPRAIMLASPDTVAGGPSALAPNDAALLAWRDWCAAHAGQRCYVALSSCWILSMAEQAPPEDARAAALQRWGHYLGEADLEGAGNWSTRVSSFDGASLVCMAPRALLQDILALAGKQHVNVCWIGPWWAQGLARWLMAPPPEGGTGTSDVRHRTLELREPGWTVYVHAEGKRLVNIWSGPSDDLDSSGSPDEMPRISIPTSAGGSALNDEADLSSLILGASKCWTESA